MRDLIIIARSTYYIFGEIIKASTNDNINSIIGSVCMCDGTLLHAVHGLFRINETRSLNWK